jgi:radical SAM superfamily enzyme YgiQ (UPF0313 family)
MKILLISVNREKFPAPVLPLGAAYMVEAMEQGGHNVTFLDLCFTADALEAVKKELKENPPQVACISIRNIDNQTLWQPVTFIHYIKEVVDLCKSLPGTKVIIGGAAFNVMPENFFKFLQPHLGVIGEGEEIINDILKDIDNIPGMCEKPFLMTPIDPVDKTYRPYLSSVEIDRIFPARDYYDHRYYDFEAKGMVPKESIQTRRGCHFSCNYCKSPQVEGTALRTRNLDHVMEEIESIIAKGIDSFFFVDNNFNYPPEYAKELCRRMIKNKYKINWMCYLAPKTVDPELAGLMKAAGCTSVYFGTDHLDDKMLDKMEKGFRVEDVIRCDAICAEAGMKTIHSILFGGIGENLQTILSCLENLERLSTNVIFFSLGIRLYPGTQLYRYALENNPPLTLRPPLEPTFFLSREVPLEESVAAIVDYMEKNKPQKFIKCTFPIEAATLSCLKNIKQGVNYYE